MAQGELLRERQVLDLWKASLHSVARPLCQSVKGQALSQVQETACELLLEVTCDLHFLVRICHGWT